MELLKVDTIEEMIEKLTRYVGRLPLHIVEAEHFRALDHVLAEDIIAQENVPGFNRSNVDGYAVRSMDTGGASESMPTFLNVIGEVEMGKAPAGCAAHVGPGQCVYVPTGGMVPAGADAVVMVEFCEDFAGDQVAVYTSVASGNNMVMAGDDVAAGQQILSRGQRLGPAHIGLLSAVGHTRVKLYKPWKISIFSTGDEIVSPDAVPVDGQVRDVNTFALIAQAEEMGFEIVRYEVVGDNEYLLSSCVAAAMADSDLVFISGGSSQGKKDVTAKIIGDLTSSGVITHGVAAKPGKPTITGFDEVSETVLIGLPGHPVAAILIFRLIAAGLWDSAVSGLGDSDGNAGNKVFSSAESLLGSRISVGRLSMNLAASPGRKTFQLVKLQWHAENFGYSKDSGELEDSGNSSNSGNSGNSSNADCTDLPLVIPVLGKSGLIRTMAEADGVVVMDVNDEGLNKGEYVKVYLL